MNVEKCCPFCGGDQAVFAMEQHRNTVERERDEARAEVERLRHLEEAVRSLVSLRVDSHIFRVDLADLRKMVNPPAERR